MPAPQVHTTEKERERQRDREKQTDLELETQRPIFIAALDSRRTDKNGRGSLSMGLDFILFGNKKVSVFCERDWLGAEEPSLPQNWELC